MLARRREHALVAWAGLSLALSQAPAGASVRVAAVQVPGRAANNRSYEQNPARHAQLIQQLQAQTREAARQEPQLIVWPEGALDFDPQVEHTAELRALAQETGAHLVLGYMVTTAPGRWRNEATTLSPAGEFLGVYGKDQPVVFGGEAHTSLGTFPAYPTAAGRLGAIICYDLDFADTARNGAQIVAVPSLDFPAIAARHYAHLVFRAVENRVAMIESDGGYDSAIVERTITPEGAAATLVATVPLGTGRPLALAVVLGDWMGWLGLAAFAFFLVFMPVTMRRAPRSA